MSTYSAGPGRSIAIIIPTLDAEKGADVGHQALIASGCTVPVRLIIVEDKHSQGFTKTANQGLRQLGPGEDACLLNDDLWDFQFGWLEILRRVLYFRKDFGLTGPSGHSGAKPMKYGRPGGVGITVVPQISFWCVLMKREMLDDIGLLDEAFIHYCSDNWYCQVMLATGWRCVWAASVFLKHQAHGSGMMREWRTHDRAVLSEYMKRGADGSPGLGPAVLR